MVRANNSADRQLITKLAKKLNSHGLEIDDIRRLFHERYGVGYASKVWIELAPYMKSWGVLTNDQIYSLFHICKLDESEITVATSRILSAKQGIPRVSRGGRNYYGFLAAIADIIDGRGNQLIEFYEMNLRKTPDKTILRANEIYEKYLQWCEDRNQRTLPIESVCAILPIDYTKRILANHEWYKPNTDAD